MVDGVKAGLPALLAVDGPRGPRNCVHRGVVDLARETDACIVVAGVFAPANRFVLKRTWDRTQLPRPFSTLTGRFRPPIDPRDFPDSASLRARVGVELLALEREFDPDEASHAGRISPRAKARSEAEARAASICLPRGGSARSALSPSRIDNRLAEFRQEAPVVEVPPRVKIGPMVGGNGAPSTP
jgi:hypothetical protein